MSRSLALVLIKLSLSLFNYYKHKEQENKIRKNLRDEYAVAKLESIIRVQERREVLDDHFGNMPDDELLNDTTDRFRRD